MPYWKHLATALVLCFTFCWDCGTLPSEKGVGPIKRLNEELEGINLHDGNLDIPSTSGIEDEIGENTYSDGLENEVRETMVGRPGGKGSDFSQAKDWDSLLTSVSLLEKEIIKLGPENMDTNLLTFKRTLKELRKCIQYSLKFQGISAKPVFLSESHKTKFNKSIMNLMKLFQEPKKLTGKYYYMEIFKNECIFKMIYYLEKYNLMPVKMKQRMAVLLKNPFVLESMSKDIFFSFQNHSNFENEFHHLFVSSNFIANHFQLANFYQFFKDFNKNQQDFVLFYLLKMTFLNTFGPEIYLEKKTSSLVDMTLPHQIGFFKKTTDFLLNELKNKNIQEDRLSFLSNMKNEIIQMRSCLTDITIQDEHHEKNEFMKSYCLQTLIFLENKFGHESVSEIGWEDRSIKDKLEFNQIFKLSKACEEGLEWLYMFYDYSNFVSVTKGTIFDLKKEVWKKKKGFYYEKVLGSLENITSISEEIKFMKNIKNEVQHERITKEFYGTIKHFWEESKSFGKKEKKNLYTVI